VAISAIGEPAKLVNQNPTPHDTQAALLLQATAQGLVRFEAGGQILPGLAQRWIVSDDGLRYTFRLAPLNWTGDGKVGAEQVVQRLRAAASPASRNRLKPVLGAIDEIVPMTEDVFEISLKSPRPRFLELLAQPELSILSDGRGSGPCTAARTAAFF
jgi:peptide/nickel transport system substrate-binding protein